MFERRLLSNAAAAALIMLSGDALAQAEQTPENAQLFIEKLFDSGELKEANINLIGQSYNQRWNYHWCSDSYVKGRPRKCGSNFVTLVYAGTVRIPNGSRTCIMQIQVSPTRENIIANGLGASFRNGNPISDSLTKSELSGSIAPFTITLDWSKVRSVRSGGFHHGTGITLATDDFVLGWNLPPELAVRALYAATVLDDGCDPTGGLGF